MKKLFLENNLRWFCSVILVSIAVMSCSDEKEMNFEYEFPIEFKIVGNAFAMKENLTIECSMDLIFELEPDFSENGKSRKYEGVHGGEMSRKVIDETGAGISLHPDVFSEIIITQNLNKKFRIFFPPNQNTGSRFWDNLGELNGTIDREGNVSGKWICAPFDTREDTTGLAEGDWELSHVK